MILLWWNVCLSGFEFITILKIWRYNSETCWNHTSHHSSQALKPRSGSVGHSSCDSHCHLLWKLRLGLKLAQIHLCLIQIFFFPFIWVPYIEPSWTCPKFTRNIIRFICFFFHHSFMESFMSTLIRNLGSKALSSSMGEESGGEPREVKSLQYICVFSY